MVEKERCPFCSSEDVECLETQDKPVPARSQRYKCENCNTYLLGEHLMCDSSHEQKNDKVICHICGLEYDLEDERISAIEHALNKHRRGDWQIFYREISNAEKMKRYEDILEKVYREAESTHNPDDILCVLDEFYTELEKNLLR